MDNNHLSAASFQNDLPNLQARVITLERENAALLAENTHLKKLLTDAGIVITPVPESLDPDQGARIIFPDAITAQMANRFFSYFWGRQDVFAKRSIKKETGAASYYRQCDNFWRYGCHRRSRDKIKCKDCHIREDKKLTIDDVKQHLEGKAVDGTDVIGVYPMLQDDTCRFIVFDFDNHAKGAEADDFANTDDAYREEVNAVRQICKANGIAALTERSRSGRGAHIWIFFEKAIPASLARRFGNALLEKGMESISVHSFTFFDRMMPMQDHLPVDGIGNLIALPLQGRALREGNSAFIDDDWNAYPDQWAALWKMPRLTQKQVEDYVAEWSSVYPLLSMAPDADGSNDAKASPGKPWDRDAAFHPEDVNGILLITMANGIYINAGNIKPRLQNQIRWLAAFRNPVFYKNLAMGIATFDTPRIIYLGSDEEGHIHIPRGLSDQLLDKCNQAGINYSIDNQSVQNKLLSITFNGELRDEQQPAVDALLRHDNGVLSAATAFGKTVVCANMIAQRRVPTLILLESSALIEQWQSALERFLIIDEELPSYSTPTGRVKRRKSHIGWLQGQHDSLSGTVDIAMAGSLCKKGSFHPLLQEYGMVIVDECHHAATNTMANVLQHIKARYVYGVTATPIRGDGLEKINHMLMGPIRYRYTSRQRAQAQGIRHLVYPRFTRTVNPYKYGEKTHPNDAYELLRNNDVRDQQIVNDIVRCIADRRTPVVLTKYTEHAERLYDRLKGAADHVFLYMGTMKKKEQKQLRAELLTVGPEESLILIATGQLIGEGFDFPRLDTLFLSTPVAWKGVVEQYAGRLNRDYEGKQDVIIYDYVDSHIPMFDNMYGKRLKAYKQIGYEVCAGPQREKQEANAIFDLDSYESIYLRDLREAREEIVISSQTMNTPKVSQLIRLSEERPELNVTIVTWAPEVYRYGRDEVRIELMNRLKAAGFKLLTVEDNCERFAVIDKEIVWYGSMNLLSKADVEDNLMRVVSKDIAAELLEMTFSGAKALVL
ncbi:MAG: DEAD/DEAH box helicase family protein [Oscillospiraceae bacterium]|nr:DEAD/DEAH box helicase family protein [Oscillospiraceae bacterium]